MFVSLFGFFVRLLGLAKPVSVVKARAMRASRANRKRKRAEMLAARGGRKHGSNVVPGKRKVARRAYKREA